MDRAVHATTSKQRCVRRIHDRVHRQPGDVAARHLQFHQLTSPQQMRPHAEKSCKRSHSVYSGVPRYD
jgi:hypothetical protein